MSASYNKAIYERLTGYEALTGDAATARTALAALLAVDTGTGRSAVRMGNYADMVFWPCITFRPDGGATDGRFVTETGAVAQSLYAFEIWGKRGGGETAIWSIAEYVEQLLDYRRGVAPAFTLTAGKAYWSAFMDELTLLYDEQTNAWCGLRRLAIIGVRP